MNKVAISAIALSMAAGMAAAQPAAFDDLGVIGGEGVYVFDTENSINVLISTGNTDTELALWDAAGTLIDSNDDTIGLGFWSEVTANLAAGVYYLGIGEFNSIFEDGFINSGSSWESGELSDVDLNINGVLAGEHNGAGDHLDQETAFFQVEVVPAPASAGLLAFGGLVATRRRR